MVNAFGCPSNLVDAFKPQSPTKSSTQPHENVEHLIHRAVKTGLSGVHLDALASRFQEYLVSQIETNSACHSDDGWTDLPDLNAFVEKHVFEAAVRSMFGTYILSLNPTLAEDFWNFNRAIGALFMGLPQWLNPAAYKARDKMLRSIEKWQKHAREHCNIESLADVDWEPYYGSKFIRERQGLLTKRGIMDETARAAENFAFMWAYVQNPLHQMLTTFRRATDTENLAPSGQTPTRSLLRRETLRLRVAVLVVREPARDNFTFRGWHIKKNEVLSVSTRTEAMDHEIWNTGGDGNPHPLDVMWADRFIVNPKDPSSGPLRSSSGKRSRGSVTATQGNEKYSKSGKSYLLPDFSGKPIIIIPPSQLKWLIDQPDHVLSTAAFHYDAQQGDYAFTQPRLLRDPYHEHVLHKSLPRKVNNLVPDIWEEVACTFDHAWGTDTQSWKDVGVQESVDHLVAPTVNRMIVGLPLCREDGYLSEMHRFTMNAVTTMTVLQFTPNLLTPLVGRLLAIPINSRFRNTSKYTLPIIIERLANFKRRELDGKWQEPNDYLSWHIALATAEGRHDELDPDIIARRLMALNFAALHTTAMGSINCLLDIVASEPAQHYIAGIREEVTRVFAEEGGKWTKAGLNRCHRADSALRESLRVSNFMSRNIQKKVIPSAGVENKLEGWRAPQGSFIAVDMHNPQHDPDIYPDPETYDAFRFSRPRETVYSSDSLSVKPEEEHEKLTDISYGRTSALTTSGIFLPFGHGRHACPGRFFIAVEIKLMLAYIVMNYDIEPLAVRPSNRWLGGIRLPPSKATIKVRRRERR
ncbi:MAG: hypothetical protein Q9166_005601 [cf. Caloplaca sp. 2 TL-2023]